MLKNLLIFSLLLSLLIVLIIYFSEKHPYKYAENNICIQDFIKLYINRYFHWTLTLFVIFYIFFTRYNFKYDIMYLLLVFLIISHWYIIGNGECIISCHEKKILNSSYKCGSIPKIQVFFDILKIHIQNYIPINFNRCGSEILLFLNIVYVIARIIYYNFFKTKNIEFLLR